MKTILKILLAVAVLGSPLLANQDPQSEKERQKKEESKKQQANPGQEPEEKPKPKPEKPKQEPAPAPAPQPKQEEKQKQKEQEKQQKEQSKQDKQKRQTKEQNTQPSAQGGRARGQKIPDAKFRAGFGREHRFRVERSSADSRRFQYSGYWFEVVEIWPAGWSFDDDCYVEEDEDDYYLVDYVHPEMRVLVIVVAG